MAAAVTLFDTYAYAQKLRGAGFSDPQVDAMTTGLSEIAMTQVATKDDIEKLRLEVKEMENRLLIRICGAVAAMLTLVTAIIKLA